MLIILNIYAMQHKLDPNTDVIYNCNYPNKPFNFYRKFDYFETSQIFILASLNGEKVLSNAISFKTLSITIYRIFNGFQINFQAYFLKKIYLYCAKLNYELLPVFN